MTLTDMLDDVQVVAGDTSLFIYYLENHPSYIDIAKAIFTRVDDNQLAVLASALALTEVLVKPLRDEKPKLQTRYRQFLLETHNISLVAIDDRIAEKAAVLRAKYNLKTPDALHIASAIVAGADVFLTNDKGIQRVDEIAVWILDDLTR